MATMKAALGLLLLAAMAGYGDGARLSGGQDRSSETLEDEMASFEPDDDQAKCDLKCGPGKVMIRGRGLCQRQCSFSQALPSNCCQDAAGTGLEPDVQTPVGTQTAKGPKVVVEEAPGGGERTEMQRTGTPRETVKPQLSKGEDGPPAGLRRQLKLPWLGRSQEVPAEVEFYAGWVPVKLSESFSQDIFVAFVRRANPEVSGSEPLVLWLNGGPGCSSMAGFLMGVGPFTLDKCGRRNGANCDPALAVNEDSWHKQANLLFMDTPPGAGFSSMSDSDLGRLRMLIGGANTQIRPDGLGRFNAKAFSAAVGAISEQFQLDFDKIYLSGESYAGIYISHMLPPLLNDDKLGSRIKGALIGNPQLGTRDRVDTVPPSLVRRCVVPKTMLDAVAASCLPDRPLHEQVDLAAKEPDSCTKAYNALYGKAGAITKMARGGTGASWYNTDLECDLCTDKGVKVDCAPECFDTAPYEQAMNQPWFHRQLAEGTSRKTSMSKWKFCTSVGKLIADFPVVPTPPILLEPSEYLPEGFRFWVFSGDTDLEITYESSVVTMTRAFGAVTKLTPWESYGDFVTVGNTYDARVIRVAGGGHLVTLYKSKASTDLLRRFLAGDPPQGGTEQFSFAPPLAKPGANKFGPPVTDLTSLALEPAVEESCKYRWFS